MIPRDNLQFNAESSETAESFTDTLLRRVAEAQQTNRLETV